MPELRRTPQEDSLILIQQRFYETFMSFKGCVQESEAILILLSKLGDVVMDSLLEKIEIEQLGFENVRLH